MTLYLFPDCTTITEQAGMQYVCRAPFPAVVVRVPASKTSRGDRDATPLCFAVMESWSMPLVRTASRSICHETCHPPLVCRPQGVLYRPHPRGRT